MARDYCPFVNHDNNDPFIQLSRLTGTKYKNQKSKILFFYQCLNTMYPVMCFIVLVMILSTISINFFI